LVRRISAREARNAFSDLIGSVYYSKEPVIVEKQGRPFVVVISPEDYERLLKEREERFAILDELSARNRDVTPEEAEADAAREIAAYRKERRAGAREQQSA
jgi:prevent-host-death family protein